MTNRHRGEISAQFDGKTYTLCLTLGALAQLEDIFQASDMLSVAERFSNGRISAPDCIAIIGIGLRAAGHDVTDETVAGFRSVSGASGYVQVVAALLEATFGTDQSETGTSAVSQSKGQEVKKNTAGKPVARKAPMLQNL